VLSVQNTLALLLVMSSKVNSVGIDGGVSSNAIDSGIYDKFIIVNYKPIVHIVSIKRI
jgi:hypothetical protein